MASNVVAMSVNSCALVWATGATVPMKRSAMKNRVSSVLGAAR